MFNFLQATDICANYLKSRILSKFDEWDWGFSSDRRIFKTQIWVLFFKVAKTVLLVIVYVLRHNSLFVAVSTRCSWMLLELKFFKLRMTWSVPWKKLHPRNFWVWVIIMIGLLLIMIMCTETFLKISLFRSVKCLVCYTYLWFDTFILLFSKYWYQIVVYIFLVKPCTETNVMVIYLLYLCFVLFVMMPQHCIYN